MKTFNHSAFQERPDYFTRLIGHDIVRQAAMNEGLEAWSRRHGSPRAYANDLFGEDDDDGWSVSLAAAMILLRSAQAALAHKSHHNTSGVLSGTAPSDFIKS